MTSKKAKEKAKEKAEYIIKEIEEFQAKMNEQSALYFLNLIVSHLDGLIDALQDNTDED